MSVPTAIPAKVVLRLISEGESEALPSGQINKVGKLGFTVWSWKNGRLLGIHAPDEKAAVKLALDIT
jgi:type III restriction enzyme